MTKTEQYTEIRKTIEKAEYWMLKDQATFAFKYINKAAELLQEVDANRNTKKLLDYWHDANQSIAKKFTC